MENLLVLIYLGARFFSTFRRLYFAYRSAFVYLYRSRARWYRRFVGPRAAEIVSSTWLRARAAVSHRPRKVALRSAINVHDVDYFEYTARPATFPPE